jgi:hydrogenase nickel incorporation protein HypA/HybF
MHEYSITQALIEILNNIALNDNIKIIKKVDFLIGPLANIEPDSIRFYYDFLSKDNDILKNAKLIFNKSPFSYYCKKCKKDFYSDKKIQKCIYCSSNELKSSDVEDLKIISIET